MELDKFDSTEELINIKILDPASGSGAFLVVCFELISQRLIELYRNDENMVNRSGFFISSNDKTYLTVEARREIIKIAYMALMWMKPPLK